MDLRIHSTASDGICTPSEIVHLAVERGLSAIAITDHDTLGGIAETEQAASGTPLEVVPGVETSAEGAWGDLHFLGYLVNPEDCPAYFPHLELEPQEAIQTILDAGGVPALAHPAQSGPAAVDAVPER